MNMNDLAKSKFIIANFSPVQADAYLPPDRSRLRPVSGYIYFLPRLFMAAKRMFSKTITNSSRFLMMPQSSQNLYFHFGMNADDDGYCEHFAIMRMTDSKPDDLKILQAKEFVKVFDDQILIILDWKENNLIRSDRYTPSKYLAIYKAELKQIESGIPDDNQRVPQVRLGKVRLGKVRKEKIKKQRILPSNIEEVKEYIKLKELNVNANTFWNYYTESGWKDRDGKDVRNYKLKLITWSGNGKYSKEHAAPKSTPSPFTPEEIEQINIERDKQMKEEWARNERS